MVEYTLSVIDTTGIQDYVFSTNNLKQIIGASQLVNCATRDWVVEVLNDLGLKHNLLDLDEDIFEKIYRPGTIKNGDFDVEVVYCGGGNAVLIFGPSKFGDSFSSAKEFTKTLTKKALDLAPGLGLVIAHQSFSFSDPLGGKGNALDQTFRKINKQKSDRLPNVPLLGLSVTAQCAFTDQPAGYLAKSATDSGQNVLISKEVKRKLEQVENGKKRLIKYLQIDDFHEPPDEIDQLGQTEGEKSFIAVVHCDGNGMGSRVEKIGETYHQAEDNLNFIQEMRKFSLSIQTAAKASLKDTVELLRRNMIEKTDDETGKRYWEIGDTIKLSEYRLPMRPVIFGGDDLTFICDGRLGLTLSAYYLDRVSRRVLSDQGPLACRAGVAVVKSHYPVARAYALAEELASSAKEAIQFQKNEFEKENQNVSVSAMDWHFAVNGLVTGLGDIREREYQVDHGSLLLRPFVVSVVPEQCQKEVGELCGTLPVTNNDWQTWGSFNRVMDSFTGADWIEHRSVLKNFRQLLREGGEAFRLHKQNIRMTAELPDVSLQDNFNRFAKKTGWINKNCVYFDAIEALDYYIPVDTRYVEEVES